MGASMRVQPALALYANKIINNKTKNKEIISYEYAKNLTCI